MRKYPIPRDQLSDIEVMIDAGDTEGIRRAINAAFFDGFLCSVGIDFEQMTTEHLYAAAVDAVKANEKFRRKWDFK